VPRVDILLCHDIGRMTHGVAHDARVAEFLDGGYRAMRELRDAGVVRAVGLGVNESEICVELLASCEFDCILLAGRYTLLEQPALETLLPLCEQRRVSIICGGPFNSGILAAGSRAGAQTHYNYAAPPAAVLERVTRLEALCADFSVPLQAAALQFPLGHPRVASVVAGCANGAEARNCAAMFSFPIPPGFWLALRERGLVDARAPLPA
jgi:D-threo-aldose 1-dehydrogenase